MIRSKNYNYARILYQQRVEAIKKIKQGKPQSKVNYVKDGVIKSIVEENKIRKKHVKSEKQIKKEKLRGVKKAHDIARRKLKREKIEALKNN